MAETWSYPFGLVSVMIGTPGNASVDFLGMLPGREVANRLDALAGNVAVERPHVSLVGFAWLEVELARTV